MPKSPNDTPSPEKKSKLPNETSAPEKAAPAPTAQHHTPPPAAVHEALRANGSQTDGDDKPEDPTRPATKPARAGTGPLAVVGIGASAGGVQALQQLFGEMPTDTNLAFVVVIHLSPDYESSLAEILQAQTKMPVIQVSKEVAVKPNAVYVIPPNKLLQMTDGKVTLSEPQIETGRRVAIDLFFRTLAEQWGQKSVCIILSGGDSDGVIGLKHIKAQGGVTIAQDPSEAEHDSMPRSAIETGMVDWILPITEMPARLRQFVRNEQAMKLPPEEDGEGSTVPDLAKGAPGAPIVARKTNNAEDENALRQVLTFVRSQTGHDFAQYKRATVLRRVARRLQVNSLNDIPAYLEFLQTHPGEARALLNDLLIGVTHFFRDQASFAVLESHIPQIFVGKRPADQVRVWVPGCATGEEAYSIAILLFEQSARMDHSPAIQIFATDLDEDAIDTAREGTFPLTIEADVSQERLRRFFFNYHGRYRVKKEIRELVLFADHDLLRDSPFSRIDLISCRNLLIYLKPEAQHRVIDIFHFALRPGGLLLLGGSENIEETHPLFTPIDKKHRLFNRRSVPRMPVVNLYNPPRRQRLPDTILPRFATRMIEQEFRPPEEQSATGGVMPFRSLGELHLALLEQYAPPSVIVDEKHEILHMSPTVGQFLQLAGGEPSQDLLRLIDPSLRLELRSALFRAAQEDTRVSLTGLRLVREGNSRLIDVHVRPYSGPNSAARLFLVVFEDHAATTGPAEAPPRESEDSVALHLEDEVHQLRAQLNTTVEQYEASGEELKASNEELQAMNEELRSATEELETSKEELQSINEELTTVNHELKSNLEELSRANSDLQNLMASTDIATVFLDRQLRIKRFTPRLQEIFSVISSDIGRPLSDLTSKLRYAELAEDAQRVLDTLEKQECEVQADGHWFIARIAPYRTVEDKIEGVVVTFVDITERKHAEENVRSNMEEVQRFNKVAVGRETRMIALKKEINELCQKLGEKPRYPLQFEKASGGET
jgi:two-component system CheB/CheR fusion protein